MKILYYLNRITIDKMDDRIDEHNRFRLDIGHRVDNKLKSIPCSIQIFQESKFSDKWMGINSLILTFSDYEKITEKIQEMLSKE